MDHMDGYWICDQQNRTWRVLGAPFNQTAQHDIMDCCGNCAQHPLIDEQILQLFHSEALDLDWGDIIMHEEFAAIQHETAEQRVAREAKEAANKAAAALTQRATEMARYARLKAQVNTVMVKDDRGKKVATIRKVQEPCKWLYLDEKAPSHEWRTNRRTGKQEPPYRPYLTGAQCWAWEYIDPKTKQRVVKHTCDHLHPGEEDWCAEWAKDRNYCPAATAAPPTRDFSGLAAGSGGFSTPSKHSDSRSTTSTASTFSSISIHSAPGAPRKAAPQNTRTSGGFSRKGGFSALLFDD